MVQGSRGCAYRKEKEADSYLASFAKPSPTGRKPGDPCPVGLVPYSRDCVKGRYMTTATVSPPDWLPELELWENAKYDGIKGSPPEWVPKYHKDIFHKIQIGCFFDVCKDRISYKELKKSFDDCIKTDNAFLKMGLLKARGGVLKIDVDDLQQLVDIYRAVRLGPVKGLHLLAGDDAVSGYVLKKKRMVGTKKSNARFDNARTFSQSVAKNNWEEDGAQKIGEVAIFIHEQISRDLDAFGLKKAPATATIKQWIEKIAPTSARKPGRPAKK